MGTHQTAADAAANHRADREGDGKEQSDRCRKRPHPGAIAHDSRLINRILALLELRNVILSQVRGGRRTLTDYNSPSPNVLASSFFMSPLISGSTFKSSKALLSLSFNASLGH